LAKKTKTTYVCQNCGVTSAKWVGKCNSCNEWNTFVEEVIVAENSFQKNSALAPAKKPQRLSEIKLEDQERINTHSSEFNRVLGGGIVKGSIILLGGEPGIGKSTLVLQTVLSIIDQKVLYISGEESLHQIKLRAQRIAKENDNCYLLSETILENVLHQINELEPKLVIIDSIQTLRTEKAESTPGSVTQIRECATQILDFAKQSNIPFIIIGHINKDGYIAGPKILEHIVDVVLQFEGDSNYIYRILRSIKNRFGSTSEIGIFEMLSNGLREITNPSEILISKQENPLSGVAISASMEGMRPLLIEVQSLTSTAAYGTPQRSANGFDLKRLNMLLAVLEKRVGFKLATKDVFLNIAGGIKVNDPAIDLAVVVAILSSSLNISIENDVLFAGEIGLTGEIRAINRIEQRIQEAEKIGFKKIFVPANQKFSTKFEHIKVVQASKIEEVFRKLFK